MNTGIGFCCLLLILVLCAEADVQTSDTPIVSSSYSPSPRLSKKSLSTFITSTTASTPQLSSTLSSPPPPTTTSTPTTTAKPCFSLDKSCQELQQCCQAEHVTCNNVCQCDKNFFQDGTECRNVSRLKVTNITATSVGERYITLGWTNPENTYLKLTYTVQGHSWNSSTDKTITGLRPGQLYEIVITSSITQYNVTKQVNSTPVCIRTYPSQVTRLNNPARKVPASKFSLTFNKSDGEASWYIITVKLKNVTAFNTTVYDNTTETIQTQIEDLQPATTYTVSIVTVSGDRYSNASTFSFTTKDEQAGVITRFNVTNVTNTSISVSWSPPHETRGNIIGYSLNVSSGPNDQDFQLFLFCSNCSYIRKTLKLQDGIGTNISLNTNNGVQYIINNLRPFEEYTLTVNAYNEAGQGETYVNSTRTCIGVPSQPKAFKAFNISSSTVSLSWTHADHQDGPTIYYITVGEATHLTSDSFGEKKTVNTSGFENTSVVVEGLRSYWKYTFNITAATSVGNSRILSLNETVRTKESAPGKVENLHIDTIPDNYTSVKVSFACLKETERHGNITHYTLSYDAQEPNPSMVSQNHGELNISAQPESNCTYLCVVPVTAQVTYIFSVQAFNKHEGGISATNFTTLTGESGPVASFVVLNTTAHNITIQWARPSLPNGNILGYLIEVTSDGKVDQVINVTCEQSEQKEDCNVVNPPNNKSAAVVNRDGNGKYHYIIADLKSYTNYKIDISCVNINGTGQKINTTLQTETAVPSPPQEFFAVVNSSSDVTLFWKPAKHQDGLTTYYIKVMEETSRNSGTFQERNVTSVRGYNTTSVLVDGLLSYWMYNFSITAATSCGNSSVLFLNASIQTKESAPGKVENLHIDTIPDNYTSVKVSFACLKETEKHGNITHYTLSYDAQEANPSTVSQNHGELNISAQPESNCTYLRVVPVTAQVNYIFSVQAFNKHEGEISTTTFTTLTGESGPVTSFVVLNTKAHSITIQWTRPSLPNGNILGYLIEVTSDGKVEQVINVTCEQLKEDCNVANPPNNKSAAVVNRDGNGKYHYIIADLKSYTNYKIDISCVNINGAGQKMNTTLQTETAVPSPPQEFFAVVNSSSDVTLFWKPAKHQDGLTTYYIKVMEETSRNSGTFQERNVTSVRGYNSTSVLVDGLLSYWMYNFSITAATSCGNSSVLSLNASIQTKESVPKPPRDFDAFVNSSSDVFLFWTPAEHQDGPTTYYIKVLEETSLNSGTFQEKNDTSVRGYNTTSVLVDGLLSYWMYNFSITAATSCGNSSVLSLNESIQTEESAPGDVENLHIDQFSGNFTSAEVSFSCPKERERHGILKYYILSYVAQGTNTTSVNISADSEPDCNYSAVVPVTAQAEYTFSVQAFNSYEGKKHSRNYTTLTGVPGPVDSFYVLETAIQSITIQWTQPSFPNGKILGYMINVTSDVNGTRLINVICEPATSQKKHSCKTTDTPDNTSGAVVIHDGSGQYDYNITALASYTDYTIAISCVNINGTGEETTTTVQTNMTVPSPPKVFRASVSSSSSVTLSWTHADHQDGPTTYYITVEEETHLTSDTFIEKVVVNVSGFYNTSVLVEGLRSYWNYTFNIAAATPVGNSSVLSLNDSVRTEESAPGQVENLHIEPIDDNFTNVEVFFSCPNETERHGDIKYYTLSYEAQVEDHTNVTENRRGLNISVEPELKCSYSQVVSVTPQINYNFSVVAHDSFPGTVTTENHFAIIGTPGNISEFTSTSTTSTSISLYWEPPRYPNGYILGYILYVHTEDWECQQGVHIVCTDCQSHGTFRVEDERCQNVTVQKHETSPTNYNVTSLLSYTNYTFTVAAVNNFSVGINTSLHVQTDIGVPSMPGNLSASVVNASAAEIRWTSPTHKSGPTDYTIFLQQATGRLTSKFENIRNVTVNGYESSKTTINGLLNSWRYTFSIIASTSKGGSLPVNLGRNIITQESEPCEVQNLTVSSIPGNFTAVNLTWDCPKERERNGFIKNYTIEYSDSRSEPTDYFSYTSEDPCDKPHTAILTVRPEHNYTFKVSANAMFRGKPKQSKVFYATTGKPLKVDTKEIFDIGAQSTDTDTDVSFVISFDSKTLLDDTNGKIIAAGILVMKKSETPSADPANVTEWDTWKNWYSWKNSGYKGSYRPTPEQYLLPARRRRSVSPGDSLTSYSVGADENCESKKDEFCNGPLEPETTYKVVAVSCTTAGCTSTEPFGNFKTKPTSIVGAVVGGLVAAVVVIGVVVGVVVLRRRRRRKSEESDDDDEESQHEVEESVDKTVPRKITDFDEIVTDLYKDSKLLFIAEWKQLTAATVKHPAEHAALVGNRSKNRYVNIMAYDHSRVKLLPLDEDECSDYINANYIPGYNSPREYIASQGPLSQTTVDFWRMIWEQKVPIIVMLTGLMENGVTKLDMYWPEEMNAPRQYGDLVVELINLSPLSKYTIMIFNISLGKETRKVKHFFLPGWHDYNANLNEGDVIDFARYVRAELKPTDEGPMLVHCSAGVGRTGTYLCVDYFIQVIDNCDIDDEVDIFSYVLKMRNNRPFMVQSEKQYVFIYDAVKEMINRKKRLLMGEQEEHIYQNQGFVPDEADADNIYMNVEAGAARM